MTVKELKEKLDRYPDDLIVMIPNQDLHRTPIPVWSVPATNVGRGLNEEDGFIFIDNCDED